MTPTDTAAIVRQLDRPHPDLLKYYILRSLLLGPFFLFALIPSIFRYRTLRYRFDEEGVSMRWGLLFRREISLTYPRIQDIHLASNAVERAFGLGRVQVQTASGAAGAEITVEGLREFEIVRDFLYARMRGAQSGQPQPAASTPAPQTPTAPSPTGTTVSPTTVAGAPLAATLEAIADELAGLRRDLASRPGNQKQEHR